MLEYESIVDKRLINLKSSNLRFTKEQVFLEIGFSSKETQRFNL